MESNLRKIYLFHFFNNIAISVVANFLFLDRIFLRLDLNMAQFGAIKGFAYLLPMGINLLLSPVIGKFNRDREIVAIGYIIRSFLPLSFLLLPNLTDDTSVLTVAASIILITVHIFPMIANNSIHVLVRANVPSKVLGIHLSRIALVWTLPGFVLAIPLSRILDVYSAGTDQQFYRVMFLIMFGTALVEIAASYIIWKLPRPHLEKKPELRFRDILQPYRNRKFLNILIFIAAFTTLNSMITSFINPYLLNVQGISMTMISLVSALVSVLSILILPFWGKLADRVGGRNILKLAVLGLGIGVFALLGQGLFFILVYGLFSWEGTRGLFGSGVYSTQQYMVYSQSDAEKRPVYFAAATFSLGIGRFFGSILGGFFLEGLRNVESFSKPITAYRIYFALCAVGCLLLVRVARRVPADRKGRGARGMWIAIYGTIRTFFGKIR